MRRRRRRRRKGVRRRRVVGLTFRLHLAQCPRAFAEEFAGCKAEHLVDKTRTKRNPEH